jgi:Ion channel
MIYAWNYHSLHGAEQPITGFYFSIITQLTIGYGDVHPLGWLRLIVALQGLLTAVFVIFVLARAAAALPITDARTKTKNEEPPYLC